MKPNKRTRIFWTLVATIFAFSMLAGCNGNTGTPQKSEPTSSQVASSNDPVEMVYWQAATSDTIVSDMEAVAARFKEKNPNVTVKIEAFPGSDMANKVQTALMANAQPDLLRDFIGRMGTYMNAGKLISLNDVFTDSYKSLFAESFFAQATKDGNIYMFPESVSFYGALVNKDLFASAGAENLLPKDPDRTWTRGEFETALTALKAKNIMGTAFYEKSQSGDINTKLLIEGGTGASLYSDDFSKCLYDSARTVDGLKWMISLIDKGLAAPKAESLIDDDVWEMFAQQQIAVIFCDLWAKSWVEGRIKAGEIKSFDIMVAQFPNAEGSKAKTASPLTGYSIFDKGDKNKESYGKEFFKFMIESPEREENIKLQGMFPALLSLSDMYSDDSESNWIANNMSKFIYDAGYGSKGFEEIRTLLNPEMQAAFAKIKTPEQAMKDFTTKANEVLAK